MTDARPHCSLCPKSAVYDFRILRMCAHCLTAELKRHRIPNSSFADGKASSGDVATADASAPGPSAVVTNISQLPRGGSPVTVGVRLEPASAVTPIATGNSNRPSDVQGIAGAGR